MSESKSRFVRSLLVAAIGFHTLMFQIACNDFAPSSRIENARVIAIVSEPAQAMPGQQVQFQAFVASAQGLSTSDEVLSTWFQCAENEAALLDAPLSCKEPSARIELGNDLVQNVNVPENFLPAQDDNSKGDPLLAQLFGRYFTMHHKSIALTSQPLSTRLSAKRVTVIPEVPLAETEARLAEFDVFYDAQGNVRPNQNPILIDLNLLNEKGDVATETVPYGSLLNIEPIIDAASIESYFSLGIDFSVLDLSSPSVVTELSDAELKQAFTRRQRCEVPTFSWFVSDGVLQKPLTAYGAFGYFLEVNQGIQCAEEDIPLGAPNNQWVLPSAEEALFDEVHLYVVLRDGRGGTDVFTRSLRLE